MRTLLKVWAAACCFAAGGTLLASYGVPAAHDIASPAHGMALLNLAGAAAAAGAIGAGLDLLTSRRGKARQEGVANSIWATHAHLNHYKITED